jgi:protocatechuate 3,4-dioxygenase beta subunit
VIAIAALLLMTLGQPPQPARDTHAAGAAGTANGRITGVVVSDEPQPRPLRRARITLTGAGLDTPQTAITADDGSFGFDALPAGRFTLVAAKEPYVSMAYGARRPGRPGTGIQIAAGQAVPLTVRLPRGAVITGTVLDVDGRPAIGVPVYALSSRSGGGVIERQWINVPGVIPGNTDDRGVYRIYGLPAGEYVVSAQPALRGVPGGPNAEIRLMQAGKVASRPVTLAQVFHGGGADLSRAARIAVRAGEERAAVDIQLEYLPLATVSGIVSSPPGWTPARVSLWRTDEAAQPTGAAAVTADAQGAFTFRGVRPGTYRFAARAVPHADGGDVRAPSVTDAARFALADVAVAGDDVEGVALSLQPPLTLAGRIVFETDRAVPPAALQLRMGAPAVLAGAGGGWPMPTVIVDGTTFRVAGMVPGLYRMMLTPPGVRAPIGSWWLTSISAGGRELLDAPLDLQQSVDDAVATLSDRASEVSGTLRDPQGAAIPDLWVVVFPVDRTGWFSHSRRVAAVRANREGQWTVRNLPPGEYRVVSGDFEQFEWFDPAVLERFSPEATPIRIAGPEKHTVDLVVR